HGVRPLVLGRLSQGWVVASETCALDIVGAQFIREVEPGELISVDEAGIRSEKFAQAKRQGCVFEYVYLARPDTVIRGRNVRGTRVRTGGAVAESRPAEGGEMVSRVAESGNPAAVGCARESGLTFAHGLVKNAYVGRTFIQPTQTLRQLGIRLKLSPLRDVIE